jgi:hypothetical protein
MQAALKLASRRARHRLAKQALALLHRANAIELRGEGAAPEAESLERPRSFPYRLHFFDLAGAVLARDAFTCDSDATAQKVAHRLLASCADIFASYELWSGARRIGKRTLVPDAAVAIPDDEPLADWVQEIVVERERILHESRSRIVEGRLLAAGATASVALKE